ncbi:MAG: hypothetical protein AB8G26_03400 [Ilumatobacter sp.]
MRRTLLAVPVLVLVAACSGTENFRSQTEAYLNDDSEVEQNMGGDVTDAECVEPENTDVGTRYTCTAVVDGVTVGFDVEITEADRFVVTPQG